MVKKELKTVPKHSPSILFLQADARLNFRLYPTMQRDPTSPEIRDSCISVDAGPQISCDVWKGVYLATIVILFSEFATFPYSKYFAALEGENCTYCDEGLIRRRYKYLT